MGYYERTYDEDGNPEDLVYVKEEPDCPPCGDSGVIDSRLSRRRSRPCPSCQPTRLDIMVARARKALWHRRTTAHSDEAPF